jgi:hypothetical protein
VSDDVSTELAMSDISSELDAGDPSSSETSFDLVSDSSFQEGDAASSESTLPDNRTLTETQPPSVGSEQSAAHDDGTISSETSDEDSAASDLISDHGQDPLSSHVANDDGQDDGSDDTASDNGQDVVSDDTANDYSQDDVFDDMIDDQ